MKIVITLTTTGTLTFDDDIRIRNDFNLLQYNKNNTWVSSWWNKQRGRTSSTGILSRKI